VILSRMMGVTLVVALFSFHAEATMYWAPAPVDHGHNGGHDRHAAKQYLLVNGDGASAQLIDPTQKATDVPVENGRVKVRSTGVDNYHALVATKQSGQTQESAVRYVYMFGRPSGESPAALMGMEKASLEVEPAPYAREHWRYQAGKDVHFILRFNSEPLRGGVVKVHTSNGSVHELKSDLNGRVTYSIPRDFADVKSGRMANHPAELILTARHKSGGVKHITTFTADYHVNPDNWQSTTLGLSLIAGSVVLALLALITLRRREKR